jgi:hypothetical protein
MVADADYDAGQHRLSGVLPSVYPQYLAGEMKRSFDLDPSIELR